MPGKPRGIPAAPKLKPFCQRVCPASDAYATIGMGPLPDTAWWTWPAAALQSHCGIQRHSVQRGSAAAAFKWTAHTGVRTGEAPNRPLAIIQALKAIDRDAQQLRAALRKVKRESKW